MHIQTSGSRVFMFDVDSFISSYKLLKHNLRLLYFTWPLPFLCHLHLLIAKVAIYFEEYFDFCVSKINSAATFLEYRCESFLQHCWSVWQHMCACSKTTLVLYCVMMDLNVSLSFNQVKQRHLVPLSSQSSSPPALSHNTAGQHSTAQHRRLTPPRHLYLDV